MLRELERGWVWVAEPVVWLWIGNRVAPGKEANSDYNEQRLQEQIGPSDRDWIHIRISTAVEDRKNCGLTAELLEQRTLTAHSHQREAEQISFFEFCISGFMSVLPG